MEGTSGCVQVVFLHGSAAHAVLAAPVSSASSRRRTLRGNSGPGQWDEGKRERRQRCQRFGPRSSGKPGEKKKAPWEHAKNPRAFSRTRRSDLVAREAPGLRSSEAKPQSWFHAHRVKALTATAGSDTRYGYTYVRMLDGRNRSVVSRSRSASSRKRDEGARPSQKEIAELA